MPRVTQALHAGSYLASHKSLVPKRQSKSGCIALNSLLLLFREGQASALLTLFSNPLELCPSSFLAINAHVCTLTYAWYSWWSSFNWLRTWEAQLSNGGVCRRYSLESDYGGTDSLLEE
jgi:hypothetical protein